MEQCVATDRFPPILGGPQVFRLDQFGYPIFTNVICQHPRTRGASAEPEEEDSVARLVSRHEVQVCLPADGSLTKAYGAADEPSRNPLAEDLDGQSLVLVHTNARIVPR